MEFLEFVDGVIPEVPVKIVVQSISHCCLVARTGQSVRFQMGVE